MDSKNRPTKGRRESFDTVAGPDFYLAACRKAVDVGVYPDGHVVLKGFRCGFRECPRRCTALPYRSWIKNHILFHFGSWFVTSLSDAEYKQALEVMKNKAIGYFSLRGLQEPVLLLTSQPIFSHSTVFKPDTLAKFINLVMEGTSWKSRCRIEVEAKGIHDSDYMLIAGSLREIVAELEKCGYGVESAVNGVFFLYPETDCAKSYGDFKRYFGSKSSLLV